MARTFTLSQLRTAVRNRADMAGGFISDSELNTFLSSSYTWLYNLLVKSGLGYAGEKNHKFYTVAAVKATGSITCTTKANMVDTETLTLDDGRNNGSYVFEFNTTGSSYTAGRTLVDISGDTSAADVAARLITAINSTNIGITASSGGTGIVTLTNDDYGEAGNVTVTDTVAHANFAVSGMSGGIDGDRYDLPSDYFGTVGVEYLSGSTWIPLYRMLPQERNDYADQGGSRALAYRTLGSSLALYPTPPSGQTYRHVYVPAPADLTTDSQTVDGVAGWEDLIIVDAAIKCREKEESDTRGLRADKAELMARVAEEAEMRELATPGRIADVNGPARLEGDFDIRGVKWGDL